MPYRQTDRRLVRFVTASSRSGTRRFGGEARKIACRGRECKSSLTNGCQCRASFIPGQANALPSNTRGGSRMPESGSSGSVRGALRNERPLYVATCPAGDDISLSSKESGEPHASLRSTNLCGRFGPASPSSAVHAGRYPGTRRAADPAYKVARRGALPCSSTIMVAGMSDATVGVDVSKETLDASSARGQRRQGKIFPNGPDGWKQMLSWIKAMGSKQAHVCME